MQRELSDSDAGGELRARTASVAAAGRTQTVYALKVLVGSEMQACEVRAGAAGPVADEPVVKAAGSREARSVPAENLRPAGAPAKAAPAAVTVQGVSAAEAERRLLSIARSLGGGVGGAEFARQAEMSKDVPADSSPAGAVGSAPLAATAGASRTLVLRIPAGQVETFARALAYWGRVSPGAGSLKRELSPAAWRYDLGPGSEAGPADAAEQGGPARTAAKIPESAGDESAFRAPADPAAAVYLLVTIEEAAAAEPAGEK